MTFGIQDKEDSGFSLKLQSICEILSMVSAICSLARDVCVSSRSIKLDSDFVQEKKVLHDYVVFARNPSELVRLFILTNTAT